MNKLRVLTSLSTKLNLKHIYQQKYVGEKSKVIKQNLWNYWKKSVHTGAVFLHSNRTLVTMKPQLPNFEKLFTPELKTLVALFESRKFEIRIAGGAVRDLILGKIPQDVDFATTATPDQMKALFEEENIRMINAKGEKHGTITCRINDKENFEVTTLRIDVITDGRHAEVEFTTDWKLDAERRDLTINSMFLGFDGTVYDYYEGTKDLENRRIRFVGNPVSRIQEDYLRILRYFRFYGRVSESPYSHEGETLAAIRENMDGLSRISGERIWVEFKKILVGKYAGSLVRVMLECGIAQYIGLPSACKIDEFEKIVERCNGTDPMPCTLLAALLSTEEQMYKLNERLRISREELRLGLFIICHRCDEMTDNKMKYCKDLMSDSVGKEPRTKEKICELLKYTGNKHLLEEFTQWNMPKFPVSGVSLLQAGVAKGPSLAKALVLLRQKWKLSDFTLTEKELLNSVDEIKKYLNK